MTALDTLRAATLNTPSLGRPPDFGSIARGGFAGLIAINGDLLKDIERIRHAAGVIRQGALIYRGGTR